MNMEELQIALARSERLRLEERKGRTNAEKKLRECLDQQHKSISNTENIEKTYSLPPIGHMHSCFPDRRGAYKVVFITPY